jgi:hypothetical protein
MRRTLSTAVLVLTFGCPISAGVIHNPPPQPMRLSCDFMLSTNNMETASAEANEPGVSDGLTELTRELLAVLPALL